MTVWKTEELPQEAPKSMKAFVAGLSLAELETIAIEKLSEALQACNASLEPELAMRLANATLDRSRGKPGQQVTVDQNLNVVTVNAQIHFVKTQPVIDNSIITLENNQIDNQA